MKTPLERFRALPQYAQNEILNNHRDINTDHDWWGDVYEQFIEKVHKNGFEINKRSTKLRSGNHVWKPVIQFTGFWSQGDGASFDGFLPLTTLKQHLSNYPLLLEYHKAMAILISWESEGRYCHKYSLRFKSEWKDPIRLSRLGGLRLRAAEQINHEAHKQAEAFADAIKDKVYALCDELYSDLQTEYEYLTSDELILEYLGSNDELENAVEEYENENLS